MKFLCRHISAFLEFAQAEAGTDQGKIVADLLPRKPVQFALSCRGTRGTAKKGPGDICEITARPHHIGIQTHQISGFHLSRRCFLKPGIDPWSRCQHPALVPVSVVRKIGVVQQPPELNLADAGSQRLLEPGDAMFSDRHCPADTVDLIG